MPGVRKLPFSRIPPAIFPVLLGMLGVGMFWQRFAGLNDWDVTPFAIVNAAMSAFFIFCALAYGTKFLRRFGVFDEDRLTLPGRGGLAAASMCVMLVSAIVAPYAPEMSAFLLIYGLVQHVLYGGFVLNDLRFGPPGTPRATPILHLVFAGVVVAPATAVFHGWTMLAEILMWYTVFVAIVVSIVTLPYLFGTKEKEWLRPLHGIHLSPTGLGASAAFLLGTDWLGWLMLAWATIVAICLIGRLRWVLEGGFSGFWSAFTFPMAAFSGGWLSAAETTGSGLLFALAGALGLIATAITLYVAVRVGRLWSSGVLAEKTNAARA